MKKFSLILLLLAPLSGIAAQNDSWKIVRSTPTININSRGGSLAVRNEVRSNNLDQNVPEGELYRIIVKFKDSTTARADVDSKELRVSANVDKLSVVTTDFGITYQPLFVRSQTELLDMESRAAKRSGRSQPDLSGFIVATTPVRGSAETIAAAKALEALDVVEFVSIESTTKNYPPPEDYAPPTLDYTSYQGHLPPNPGVDADYAYSVGADGAGIRFSDIEGGVPMIDHEDMVDADITLFNTNSGSTYSSHATPVVGLTMAQDNGYGMRGLAPASKCTFYSAEFDWLNAYIGAIGDSAAGDIVLFESQTGGETIDEVVVLVATEYDPTVWALVRMGADAGVVIVAAAGNGNGDLDRPFYDTYMARGDSGAIIVGAGTGDLAHNKASFSTYGSRVDVHGWGDWSVATLGDISTGDIWNGDGDTRQCYHSYFSGTSSGSAMVAGVCTALQSYCLKNFGFTLGPIEIRQLLKDTGIAQGAGGHIGPLPNMRAAIEALNDQYLPTLVATPDSITVTEGEAGEFYVKLSNMPVSNITVTLTVSNYNADVQITSTNTLLYTDSNWNTNQTVTVLMGHDAGFISGYGTITMSAPQFTNEYIVYETETDLDPDFSLPFNETFENDGTNAGVLGPVDGQHGWVSESTNVVVVNSDAYAGSQSCAVENGILNHQYYDAQTNVQVIFYAKDQTITEDVREVPDTVAAGFHLNADRNIVAYSNTVQLTYTNLTVNLGTWYKYTLNCDYGNREWSLYVDDNLVFTNLAFGTNVAVSFSSVEVDNDRSATPSYIDNFSIISLGDEVPPGNIPSWWLDYYFTNGADSAEDADPDGDSFDNYAEWIALTDPTNSSSFFEMSDVATAAGDSVILWQGNSNRMYSVWWTSDLDLNFSSVTTGLYGVTGLNTYTDSIERVSDPNFYLIKVNLPE